MCAVVSRVAGSSWARVVLLRSCVCVSSVFLLCFVWVVQSVSACSSRVSCTKLVCAVVSRVARSSWARVLLLGSCVFLCV